MSATSTKKEYDRLAASLDKLINRVDKLEKSQRKNKKATKDSKKSVDSFTKAATSGATGVSHLRNQTNKATGSFTLFQKSLSVARSRLLVLSFGFALVNKSILNLLRTYGEQQKAEIQLGQALGFTSKKLHQKAAALQSVTTFGDEEVLKAMGLIAAYIKEEDQISNVTEATLDLAAAKGMDLTTAADLVAKSVGSSTNALSRYGIEVNGVVGTSERLNSAISGINNLYKGQSKVLTQTVLGSMQQTSNAFGDLAERIGKDLAPILVPIIKQFKNLAEALDTRKIVAYTTAMAAVATTMSLVKAASLGAATGMKVFAKAFKMAAIGTGVGIFVVVLGELVNALFEAKGWFDSTSDSMFKFSKSQKVINEEARKQAEELRKAQDESAEKLEQQLKLLNAKSEQEKMLISLGHEASELEKTIIDQIVKKTQAVKDEIQVLKAEEEIKKRIQELESDITIKRINALKVSDKEKDVMKLLIEANEGLEKSLGVTSGTFVNLGGVMTESFIELQKVDGGFKLVGMTSNLTKKQIEELELVLDSLGLSIDNILTPAMKGNMELWSMFNSQISSTLGALDAMNSAEVDQARQRELRAAEGIQNEKQRREKIEAINKKYDAEQEKRARKLHAWKVGAAISNVALGITQTWADKTMPVWAKWVQTALQATAGYAQIRTIEAQQFAKGGDFVTSGPQMIMVGDNPGGRERVQVTPLSSPNIAGPQGGQIVVNVSGNVMTSDYVEGELAEQIKEAARRGTDFGIS